MTSVDPVGDDHSKTSRNSASPPSESPSEAKPHILIVEDDVRISQALRLFMRVWGYQGTVVNSGDFALDYFHSCFPSQEAQRTPALAVDLVLMDIKLRGNLDGIETALKIHECCDAHAVPPVPIIYLSATDEPTIFERAISTNPYGFLNKPINYADVRTMIALALHRHQQERQQIQNFTSEIDQERDLYDLKSQLLAMLHHELATPLSVIRLLVWQFQNNDPIPFLGQGQINQRNQSEISLPEIASAEMRLVELAKLNRIEQSLQDINWLLDQVKSMNRMEKNQLAVNGEKFMVVNYCRDRLRSLANLHGGKYNLEVTSTGDERILSLDRQILWHILSNLVSNAVKYSPENSLIKVVLECDPAGLELRVTDQGIGIPEDEQEQVFAPFKRCRNVNGSEHQGGIKGLGMGLYIVKQAVIAHHGKVTLTSKLGQGSTFTVYLPSLDATKGIGDGI
ncbi:MAG: hybrid sensor histidine kinase/response regulator [Pseudanabaena sp. ELA607]